MRAICPTCDTAYTIPDSRIGAAGRKVRCTKCGGSWKVMLPAAEGIPEKIPDFAEEIATETRPEAAAPEVDPFEDDGFAAIESGFDPPAPPPPAPPPPPPPAAEPIVFEAPPIVVDAPPVTAAAVVAPIDDVAPAVPRIAPDVKIRIKPHGARLRLHLPKMPVAFSRAAPFFGPLIFVTAILVIAGLAVFRDAIVATAPGLAGFYASLGLEVNLRGLTFGPIETLREVDNGQPVLVVEGTLSNTTQKQRSVPALRFALRDGDSQELYAWSVDPKATTIAAGESLRFRTRLVAPPDRAADLQVRFVERRNQQARLP